MPNISVVTDFTNTAVATAQNLSNTGYHYGKHIFTIGQAYAKDIQALF